jgi:ribosomal protein L3 glutamine methyltransferase
LTLGGLIERLAERFAAASLHFGHGTDNAHDEAAWLVLRGLGLPFDADLARALDEAALARIEALAQKRIAERIPLAYLLKEAWLAGVPFYVDERVIVPRSHIAELLKERWLARRPVRKVLDLCTGSGCLAVLAARAFPQALVDAVDLSPAALAVARKNIVRHRLARRVKLRRADLLAGMAGAAYDLIVANPPYVRAPAMAALPPEYRHEPRLALAGGNDGLDLIARILAAAPAHLAPGGVLVCEVGEGKRALERKFARLRLSWPKPEVFIYEPSRTAGASRTRATRP